ncbi:MAG TPA: alkaline phosphatase family protein, partial [Xanthobacteraceae bacterium]
MLRSGLALALACALILSPAAAQQPHPHSIILFVPDGLRALKVTPQTAPTMAMIRDKGVNFKNSHSLFPTFTTANASGMATGHYLGDTG